MLRVNKWCLVILWYHPRCLLHSWPHVTTLWATIATHLWPKRAENGWKQVLTILNSITSYSTHKSVLWANEWCSIILWYHPWCLLHSWPHIVTLWATVSTHLWSKMAENSWKQVFGDTYLHNLLIHTQICSKVQQEVSNYPLVTPKVPTTLITP